MKSTEKKDTETEEDIMLHISTYKAVKFIKAEFSVFLL